MRKPVPGKRFLLIADRRSDPNFCEKNRIKGYSHPYGRASVSRFNRALIKKTCRGDVSSGHKMIAALDKARDLGSTEGRLGQGHDLFRRRRPRLQRLAYRRGRSSWAIYRTVRYGIKDEERAIDDARRAAVKDARRQAEVYADAAGVKLAEVLEIFDGVGQNLGSEASLRAATPNVGESSPMAHPVVLSDAKEPAVGRCGQRVQIVGASARRGAKDAAHLRREKLSETCPHSQPAL